MLTLSRDSINTVYWQCQLCLVTVQCVLTTLTLDWHCIQSGLFSIFRVVYALHAYRVVCTLYIELSTHFIQSCLHTIYRVVYTLYIELSTHYILNRVLYTLHAQLCTNLPNVRTIYIAVYHLHTELSAYRVVYALPRELSTPCTPICVHYT